MRTVTVHEAKTTFVEAPAAAEAGEAVTVCRGSQPVARLVPIACATRLRPRVGEITSKRVTYAADCFEALDDNAAAAWRMW